MLPNATNQPKSIVEIGYMCPRRLSVEICIASYEKRQYQSTDHTCTQETHLAWNRENLHREVKLRLCYLIFVYYEGQSKITESCQISLKLWNVTCWN